MDNLFTPGLANDIALALNHGMALYGAEMEGITTLRQLQDRWTLLGQERNAASDYPPSGMEGWGEMETEDPDWPILTHRTGTGRLSILVARDLITLTFFAGPEGDSEWDDPAQEAGRMIVSVTVTAAETRVRWQQGGKALFAEKDSRLALLVDVDLAWGGLLSRTITDPILREYLAIWAAHGAAHEDDSEAEVILSDRLERLCSSPLVREEY